MRECEALQEPGVSGQCGSRDQRAHTVSFATPGPADRSVMGVLALESSALFIDKGARLDRGVRQG
jgi:hypothetical protein